MMFIVFITVLPALCLESVYLKNNIHYQSKNNGTHWASYANYTDPGSGHNIIPVNTKISITSKRTFKGVGILITILEDGKQIHMEYNRRNMKMPMDDYMKAIASPEKTPLNQMSQIDQKGIKEGKAHIGMSKDGVRIALGFPAQHKTPSLESNTWIYWRNRFKTTAVEFDGNGKVSSIR